MCVVLYYSLWQYLAQQVMLPKGREMVDEQYVQTKYNITHPTQMRDLQALMGDTAVRVYIFSFSVCCLFLFLSFRSI